MSRTKTHTVKSTFRAIDQIHLTLKNLVNNPFLSKENNVKIYEMYKDSINIWLDASKAAAGESDDN